MKIVDRATFLALPAGTVYAKWGSGSKGPGGDIDLTYGEVAVKGDTVSGVDWVVLDFMAWPENCDDSIEWADAMIAAINGTPTAPLEIGDFGGRDGLFDQEQLFAVFSRVEVERMVAMLNGSLETAYADEPTAS
ncbi:hypothetical protein ACIPPQ_14805 [Sphingopyxis sp. LARHCG72]